MSASIGTDAVPSQVAMDRKDYKDAGPSPKPFSVSSGQLLNVASASLPAILRLGSGLSGPGYSVSLVDDDGRYAVTKIFGKAVRETSRVEAFKRPTQPLELYEFEGCPFCRKVREAVSILDLDVVFYPCPKGGSLWRNKAIQLGGKQMFPYLVDLNTGKAMYESDDIIAYLFEEYGDGVVPLGLRLGLLTTLTAGLGMAARSGRGVTARKSTPPQQPLVLYSYEVSPFCKVVKEALCELEIAHLQRSCARGSPKRQEVKDLRGHFQVPYLEDPNRGVYLFESSAILQYLEEQYGAGAPAAAAAAS